ncbi:dynamin family protein [Actinomycetospora straminea]|uniref:Dynamin family protein n=1 Tax=Actinomycetospora straminea TaxID=663607 RepID=A0ABP9ENL5_9PSEU|nr:dynamin family protein [Actinomycetospora straminea]MDD7936757.1 dynamin family protein [Actinomycetospora straminea]
MVDAPTESVRPLSRRVGQMLRAQIDELGPGAVRDQLIAECARLDRPLRVAVAGQVSAGKSTMVNALLARRVAPTGAAETTRLFALYEFDENEGVDIELADGRVLRRSLRADGSMPTELGVPPQAVDLLRVRLSSSAMVSAVTLVDTPGLDSVRETASALTERRIFGGEGSTTVDADALIFLLQAGGRNRETEWLSAFRELTGSSLASCSINTVGVLSKIDQDNDPEPLRQFGRIAQRLAREPALRLQLATVVPVAGLLAETVRAGLLTEDHFASLQALATSLGARYATASVPLFYKAISELGGHELLAEELISRLGLFGVDRTLAGLQSGVETLGELYRVLLRESGFEAISAVISQAFMPRTDVLKADQALAATTRLSYQLPEMAGARMRSVAEELVLEPSMHQLRELHAVRACIGDDAVELPANLQEELRTLTGSGTAAQRLGLPANATADDIRSAARRKAMEAIAVGADPTVGPGERRVIDVMRMSYAALWQQADDQLAAT